MNATPDPTKPPTQAEATDPRLSAPNPGRTGRAADSEHATLDKGAIGLSRSVIFALAGAAPGQTISIVLAPLVAAAAYGTLLPILCTTLGLLCIAYAFHRLNQWRQNAGATYEWVSRAVNPYVGFFVGWIMLVAFALFILIDVITLAPGVISVLGLPDSKWWSAGFIIVLGVSLTFAAARGIRLSSRLQLIAALIEYGILAVFSVWAFIAVFFVHAAGTVHPSTNWLSMHGAGGGSFSAAMVIAVASIAGWDGGIYLNEETEAPEKNPGRGALIAVALMGVLFLIMFVAFQGISSNADLQDNAPNALALVGQRLAGGFGARLLSFAVVLSVLATTQVAIIGAARVVFSMSRDRVLPASLGKISVRWRTPAFTTFLIGGGAIVIGVADVFTSSIANALSDLINTSGLMYATFYAVTALAATWFYRRLLRESLKNALLLGLLPLSGAALIAWTAYKGATALTHTEVYALGGVTVVGLVLMVVAAKVNKAPIFSSRRESAPSTADADR